MCVLGKRCVGSRPLDAAVGARVCPSPRLLVAHEPEHSAADRGLPKQSAQPAAGVACRRRRRQHSRRARPKKARASRPRHTASDQHDISHPQSIVAECARARAIARRRTFCTQGTRTCSKTRPSKRSRLVVSARSAHYSRTRATFGTHDNPIDSRRALARHTLARWGADRLRHRVETREQQQQRQPAYHSTRAQTNQSQSGSRRRRPIERPQPRRSEQQQQQLQRPR